MQLCLLWVLSDYEGSVGVVMKPSITHFTVIGLEHVCHSQVTYGFMTVCRSFFVAEFSGCPIFRSPFFRCRFFPCRFCRESFYQRSTARRTCERPINTYSQMCLTLPSRVRIVHGPSVVARQPVEVEPGRLRRRREAVRQTDRHLAAWHRPL